MTQTTKEIIAQLGFQAALVKNIFDPCAELMKKAAERLTELDAEVKDYREAMTYAMWQHDGHGTSMHNHWYAKFQDALAKHNKGEME